jgi:hypothetical protein
MPQYVLILLEDESWEKRSNDERKRAYAAINAWVDDVRNRGIMKGGEELQSKRTATTVKRKNGAMTVTEGPFIESKEHVGGFMMIEVPDLDAAIALAKSWPGGDVEVRPIVVH